MRNDLAHRSTSLALTAALFLGVPSVALADEPASPAPPSASTGVDPAAAAPSNDGVDAPASAGVAPAVVAPPSSGVAPSWPGDGRRRFVAAAPAADGWGESELTVPPGSGRSRRYKPYRYEPPTRRNKAMAAAGGITMGTGLLTGLAGIYVGLGNQDCKVVIIFPSCHARDVGVAGASQAMMIGGLITLVVGIPILVVGLKKQPVPGGLSSFVGEPAPSGWAWRF